MGLLSVGLLAALAIGVGPASAANPTWAVSFDPTPNRVAPGKDAGWHVTVTNNGPSNINDLRITITSPDAAAPGLPSYFSGILLASGSQAVCSTSTGALVCPVGTLGDNQSVTFTVAFAPSSSQLNSVRVVIGLRAGTGDTDTDAPGKSRGDKKDFPFSTPVSTSTNYDGGFVIEATEPAFSTNQVLGRRNVQATALESFPSTIGVAIEDGPDLTVTCDGTEAPETVNPACNRLFGEWSKLNVDDGATYNTPFKVTLLVLGSAVPGGTSVEDIVLVHVLDDGTVDVIGDAEDGSEVCDSTTGTPTNADCITVTKVGGNYKIVAWLLQNGNIRGGF